MATYVGIDLHKASSHLTAVDEKGEVVANQRIIGNKEEDFVKFLALLQSPVRVVVEATRGWYWLYELLVKEGYNFVLANPLKTRAIASARIKTDSLDAKILAHLLRSDLVAEAYIPTIEELELREFLRYRVSLVRIQTGIKNKVHAILGKHNLTFSGTDLFGKKGRRFLEEIKPSLPDQYQENLEKYLELLDELKAKINQADKKAYRLAKENHQAQLLVTIPGVGKITSLTILAEIGDISRFPSAKKLCSWAGLVPSTYQSSTTIHHGRITKQGSTHLRRVLVEAAQISVRQDGYLKYFHQQLSKRGGRQKATVAVARKILVAAYHILTKNQVYKEPRPTRNSNWSKVKRP